MKQTTKFVDIWQENIMHVSNYKGKQNQIKTKKQTSMLLAEPKSKLYQLISNITSIDNNQKYQIIKLLKNRSST